MKEQKFSIMHYAWLENGYEPQVDYTLSKEGDGFYMHIVVQEKDPKREKTEHFQYVHEDSCVEWFANFAPDINDGYFNFEVNANGCMNVAFRKDRFNSTPLTKEDVESFQIKSTVHEAFWEVDYTVPFAFIKKYIPGFEWKEGMTIKGNFYKCGDETDYPHFGMWNKVETENPDFHRPEYFREIVLE